MYYVPYPYPYYHTYYVNVPVYSDPYFYGTDLNEMNASWLDTADDSYVARRIPLRDYGNQPFVVNIEEAAEQNNNFRTALWTGRHLQVTLMSINPGEDIGLERHPNVDQFLRIEEGRGIVRMGDRRNNLNFVREVREDDAIMVPAGKWHNITNTGNRPLKLYSIYAPPEHPFGTVHRTKADAIRAEQGRNQNISEEDNS